MKPEPGHFERLRIAKAGLQKAPAQEPEKKGPPEHAGDTGQGRTGAQPGP